MPGKDKHKRPIVIKKVKKGGHGGHHGGSWKVAYADFVTAMMAFFMVLWILGMEQSLKDAIEGYFSNPVGFKRRSSTWPNRCSSAARTIIRIGGFRTCAGELPDDRMFCPVE